MTESAIFDPDVLHEIAIERKDQTAPQTTENSRVLIDGKELNGVLAVAYSLDADDPIPKVTLTLYAKFRSEP